jgi:hypothetical protein
MLPVAAGNHTFNLCGVCCCQVNTAGFCTMTHGVAPLLHGGEIGVLQGSLHVALEHDALFRIA